MKKSKLVIILLLLLLSVTMCGCSIPDENEVKQNENTAISGAKSEEAAIEKLTGEILSMGIVDADMRMEDSKHAEWNVEEMSEIEIAGAECYAFELRYSDDVWEEAVLGRE